MQSDLSPLISSPSTTARADDVLIRQIILGSAFCIEHFRIHLNEGVYEVAEGFGRFTTSPGERKYSTSLAFARLSAQSRARSLGHAIGSLSGNMCARKPRAKLLQANIRPRKATSTMVQ
jgi:hypothetical protein